MTHEVSKKERRKRKGGRGLGKRRGREEGKKDLHKLLSGLHGPYH